MGSTAKIEAQKALTIAIEAFLTSKIGVVEFSRCSSTAMHALEQDGNELFRYFHAIDAQTDHFPVGAVRNLWAADALRPHDTEREAVENALREVALIKAHELLGWSKSQQF